MEVQPLRTVAEEQALFTGFYRIVLEALGVQDPPPALVRELVEGEDDEVGMEPFLEVAGVLRRLPARGLRPLFDAFVISATGPHTSRPPSSLA